jgi:MFS family permease
MDDKKNIATTLFRNITETFAISLIVMVFTGWMLSGTAFERDDVFIFGVEGLSYQSIAQIFAWSCILGTLITVLSTDIFYKKTMLLWRCAVLFVLGLATSVTFAIVFRWFPLGMWTAWAGFVGFFVIGFGAGLSIMLIITKRSDRLYEKRLSEYKAKRRSNQND